MTNTSVASSLGTYFLSQISLIFLDMLNVYRMYSELISSSIVEGVPFASKTSYVNLLQSVKRETLKLIETFLDNAEDQPQIRKQFVPPMIDPVLGDYARNLPDARESLSDKTRICFRDAFYRLAKNSKQNPVALNQQGNIHVRTHSLKWTISEEKIRSRKKETTESETNTIDRTIANLTFDKMDMNVRDFPVCHT
ncbi:Exportin-1 [Gossypium australe]|uniref:Exportin-1 n=1 Tax=Gossypium australe TaxID=47621 RepID=A0A5B6WSJ4_9ROSI|nr:Exportin-1 [Gossypium australe]